MFIDRNLLLKHGGIASRVPEFGDGIIFGQLAFSTLTNVPVLAGIPVPEGRSSLQEPGKFALGVLPDALQMVCP